MKRRQPKKTPSHRALLAMKHGRKCCYCGVRLLRRGARLTDRTMHPHGETTEHLHRRADGGSDHLDNKALACLACNSQRGDMDWLTYKSWKRGEITAQEAFELSASLRWAAA